MKSMTPEPIDDIWGLVTYLLFKNGILLSSTRPAGTWPPDTAILRGSCAVSLAPFSFILFLPHDFSSTKLLFFLTTTFVIVQMTTLIYFIRGVLPWSKYTDDQVHHLLHFIPQPPFPPLSIFLILCTGLFAQKIVDCKETVGTEELCPEEV